MSWCGLEGHDDVVDRFRKSLARGRLGSTFLFVGKPGIGKRQFARRLAQALLCERVSADDLSPCLGCDSCLQIDADSHPDVEQISKPDDKSSLPLELFVGDRAHRNQEGLCHRISLRPSHGDRRIAIIDDADFLNQESANCLLKTLEEPPPRSVLILIATSEQTQLPTIRSRCQTVRFKPLPASFIVSHLQNAHPELDTSRVEEVAWLSEGSLEQAVEFLDEDLQGFREELWSMLGRTDAPDSVALAKSVTAFVESAGKEAPKRRKRLRHVIRLFILYFRQLMLTSYSVSGDVRGLLAEQTSGTHEAGRGRGAESVVDRCLRALNEVDANANLATLIECWIDDLTAAQLAANR